MAERDGVVAWKAAVAAIHTTVIKAWPAWGPEDRRFLALALAGEVGEVANLVKKDWRGDTLPALVADVTEELADCRIYLELLAGCFGVDLDAACERIVQEKLIPRWPQAKPAIAAALAAQAGGAGETPYCSVFRLGAPCMEPGTHAMCDEHFTEPAALQARLAAVEREREALRDLTQTLGDGLAILPMPPRQMVERLATAERERDAAQQLIREATPDAGA
jgi:NTP pyrophosphatase (non-canonical NTP hydrolase)